MGSAEVEIEHRRTNIIRMAMDGENLSPPADSDLQLHGAAAGDKSLLSVSDILLFADTVDIDMLAKDLAEREKENIPDLKPGIVC